MGNFPYGKSSGVTRYKITRPDGVPLAKLTYKVLHKAVKGRLIQTRIPPKMNFKEEYVWGWAWLDDKNPISAGRWTVFSMRGWKKTPPRSMVEAMLEAAIATERMENPSFKITKTWRQEKREEIEDDLRRKMAPAIEEDPIAVNEHDGTLLIFNGSQKNREAMITRIGNLLGPVLGLGSGDLLFTEDTLETVISITRPHAILPQELGSKFLRWLTARAHRREWAEVSIHGQEKPVIFQLEMNGGLKLITADGTTNIAGDKAADNAVEALEAGRMKGRPVKLRISLTMLGGRVYEFTLDDDARLVGCKLTGADDYFRKEDNLDAATTDRCEDYNRSVNLIGMIIAAFDVGPLSVWMDAAPQVSMFPGQPTGRVIWHPAEAFENAADEGQGPAADGVDDGDKRIKSIFGVEWFINGANGAEFEARLREAGLNVEAGIAYREAEGNVEKLAGWYVEGGWPRLIVEIASAGVKKAKTGPTTRLRKAEKPEALAKEGTGEVIELDVARAAAVGGTPAPSLEDAGFKWGVNKPINYEDTWKEMLKTMRDELVKMGFKMTNVRGVTRARARRNEVIEGWAKSGWGGAAAVLLKYGAKQTPPDPE